MKFFAIAEALDACEKAGFQPRSHVTGLGEQVYWVHLPNFERGICFSGDSQFLAWANSFFAAMARNRIRDQSGWEEFEDADSSPSGRAGWHAPCGTHESDWIGPFPEEDCDVEA